MEMPDLYHEFRNATTERDLVITGGVRGSEVSLARVVGIGRRGTGIVLAVLCRCTRHCLLRVSQLFVAGRISDNGFEVAF